MNKQLALKNRVQLSQSIGPLLDYRILSLTTLGQ
jgi:hypothetical protein